MKNKNIWWKTKHDEKQKHMVKNKTYDEKQNMMKTKHNEKQNMIKKKHMVKNKTYDEKQNIRWKTKHNEKQKHVVKNIIYDEKKTKTILKLTYVLLSTTTSNIGLVSSATCFGRTDHPQALNTLF